MNYTFGLFVMCVVGCGSSASTPATTTSSVTGAVTAAGFASAPSSVAATDETGAVAKAGLDATGTFRLALAKGHTYRIDVVTATGRGTGRLSPVGEQAR